MSPPGRANPPAMPRPARMNSRRPLPPEPELRSCMTSSSVRASRVPAQFIENISWRDAHRASPRDVTASAGAPGNSPGDELFGVDVLQDALGFLQLPDGIVEALGGLGVGKRRGGRTVVD